MSYRELLLFELTSVQINNNKELHNIFMQENNNALTQYDRKLFYDLCHTKNTSDALDMINDLVNQSMGYGKHDFDYLNNTMQKKAY